MVFNFTEVEHLGQYFRNPNPLTVNSLRPRLDRRPFADDIFKCIFLNENVWFPIKVSLKCVPKGQINKIPALAQIMAWRRPGDKPLSEPMVVSLPTHICVIRPQWVKGQRVGYHPQQVIRFVEISHRHCPCERQLKNIITIQRFVYDSSAIISIEVFML